MNRRDVIKGLAAAGLTVPMWPALAQLEGGGSAPRRLILFWTPNGTIMDEWHSGEPNGQWGQILEPLEPIASDLLLLRGVDMESAYLGVIPPDHVPDRLNGLSARQGVQIDGRWTIAGETIDQLIGNGLGAATRLRTLPLGVQTTNVMLGRGLDQFVGSQNNPHAVWELLFGGQTVDTDALAKRGSVLDVVAAELSDLQKQLGSEHRPLLDAHLTSVREVERGLFLSADPACGGGRPEPFDHAAPEAYPAVGRNMMDIAALALKCDLTRVVTLQWSGAASPVVHRWAGVEHEHHATSHQLGIPEPQMRDNVIAIERWYAQQFRYLVETLRATPEGDGNLLDSCAVVWVHEQSHGGTHSRRDMPYVIAGRCGGAIQPGRVVNLKGEPHARLLTALAQAMGLPTFQFGETQINSEPLGILAGGQPPF